jgi:two-component system response regulator RegX3
VSQSRPRVLVVEDEADLREAIGYALEREGFVVERAGDGESALHAARGNAFDAILLDLMLPGISGTEVCRILRAESRVPIVMLTARSAEVERVLGLEIGADDYVTKPFSMPELVSRIRALLRRVELERESQAASAGVRTVGGLRLDFGRHLVTVDGRPVLLTPSEFRVLAFLADHAEHVLTRRQIMEHLWNSPFVGDERTADAHISHLRRKIERNPNRPERIVTVRGVGYKLVPRD